MARLIKDASKMKDVQKELNVSVKDGDMSFGNIVNAISVMQKSLGIAGTSAKEAATTIEGSTNMMKAAWDNLVTGIADDDADFDKLIDNFVESAGAMFDNLLPRILIAIQGIGKLIPELGTIILEHLPEIMETGQNIINGLMQAIIQALPTLIETGTQMLQSLLNGIIQYLPQMVPVVLQVISLLINFITQNLPMILQAGITILLELIRGIAQALPELIPTIVDCILLIVDTLIENIDLIIEVGIEVILALIEGIFNALPNLIAKLPELIIKLVQALLKLIFIQLPRAGRDIVDKIIDGLFGYWNKMIQKIREFFKGTIFEPIVNKITDMAKVGLQLVQGLWEGIKNARDWLLNKIKSFAHTITNGIKKFFGIKSPSRVMRDQVGQWLPKGIAVGIEANTDSALDSIDDMNNKIFDKMSNAVNFETGKMAFSGTSGSVTQILNANSSFTGNINNILELDGEVVYNNQQKITARKNLQRGGVR